MHAFTGLTPLFDFRQTQGQSHTGPHLVTMLPDVKVVSPTSDAELAGFFRGLYEVGDLHICLSDYYKGCLTGDRDMALRTIRILKEGCPFDATLYELAMNGNFPDVIRYMIRKDVPHITLTWYKKIYTWAQAHGHLNLKTELFWLKYDHHDFDSTDLQEACSASTSDPLTVAEGGVNALAFAMRNKLSKELIKTFLENAVAKEDFEFFSTHLRLPYEMALVSKDQEVLHLFREFADRHQLRLDAMMEQERKSEEFPTIFFLPFDVDDKPAHLSTLFEETVSTNIPTPFRTELSLTDHIFAQQIVQNQKESIDSPIPLASMRQKFFPGDPHILGIDKLVQKSPSVEYYPMPLDGHCLFRAIACGFLDAVRSSKNAREHHLGCLEHALKGINDHKDQKMEDTLTTDEQKHMLVENCKYLNKLLPSVLEIVGLADCTGWQFCMQNPGVSNFMVEFLRHLAVGFLMANNKIDREKRYSIKENYDRMINTAEYGDSYELAALAKALGISIEVLHLENLGKGVPTLADNYEFLIKNSQQKISLLYRTTPLHYDLASNFR